MSQLNKIAYQSNFADRVAELALSHKSASTLPYRAVFNIAKPVAERMAAEPSLANVFKATGENIFRGSNSPNVLTSLKNIILPGYGQVREMHGIRNDYMNQAGNLARKIRGSSGSVREGLIDQIRDLTSTFRGEKDRGFTSIGAKAEPRINALKMIPPALGAAGVAGAGGMWLGNEENQQKMQELLQNQTLMERLKYILFPKAQLKKFFLGDQGVQKQSSFNKSAVGPWGAAFRTAANAAEHNPGIVRLTGQAAHSAIPGIEKLIPGFEASKIPDLGAAFEKLGPNQARRVIQYPGAAAVSHDLSWDQLPDTVRSQFIRGAPKAPGPSNLGFGGNITRGIGRGIGTVAGPDAYLNFMRSRPGQWMRQNSQGVAGIAAGAGGLGAMKGWDMHEDAKRRQERANAGFGQRLAESLQYIINPQKQGAQKQSSSFNKSAMMGELGHIGASLLRGGAKQVPPLARFAKNVMQDASGKLIQAPMAAAARGAMGAENLFGQGSAAMGERIRPLTNWIRGTVEGKAPLPAAEPFVPATKPTFRHQVKGLGLGAGLLGAGTVGAGAAMAPAYRQALGQFWQHPINNTVGAFGPEGRAEFGRTYLGLPAEGDPDAGHWHRPGILGGFNEAAPEDVYHPNVFKPMPIRPKSAIKPAIPASAPAASGYRSVAPQFEQFQSDGV